MLAMQNYLLPIYLSRFRARRQWTLPVRQASEKDLEDLFSKYGSVSDVAINIDKQSGKSKGFGFVTMDDARDAADAVKALKGYELHGREISVDVAHGGGSNTGFISRPKVYSQTNRRQNSDSNRRYAAPSLSGPI
jgi:RNA recognition motif-containing protein